MEAILLRLNQRIERGSEAMAHGAVQIYPTHLGSRALPFDRGKRTRCIDGQTLFHSHGCFLAPAWLAGWNQDTVHEREERQIPFDGKSATPPPSSGVFNHDPTLSRGRGYSYLTHRRHPAKIFEGNISLPGGGGCSAMVVLPPRCSTGKMADAPFAGPCSVGTVWTIPSKRGGDNRRFSIPPWRFNDRLYTLEPSDSPLARGSGGVVVDLPHKKSAAYPKPFEAGHAEDMMH